MTSSNSSLTIRLESTGDCLLVSLRCAQELVYQQTINNALSRVRKLAADALRMLNWHWQKSTDNATTHQQDIEDFQTVLDELAARVLTPPAVETLLANRGANLTLELPRSLASLPWELMRFGGASLLQQFGIGRILYDLCVVPASRQSRATDHPPQVCIWAHPEQDLMWVEEEAAAIHGLMLRQPASQSLRPAVTLHRGPGTKHQLLEQLHSADWFHFAGHAEPYQGQRAWVVSHDRVTAQDILDSPGPYPQLIFAHACGSAMVSQDGSGSSFIEALWERGVAHFIGLWTPIRDRQAASFAPGFYRRLLDGLAIGQACHLARVDYAERYGWDERLLGNYVLYGDPNAVLSARPVPIAPTQNDHQIAQPATPTRSAATTESLSFPVTCTTCGRKLKSRFLVDEVWLADGHWQVRCRACSHDTNAAAIASQPTARSNPGKAPTTTRLLSHPISATWQLLLESLATPRPVLNPDVGKLIPTSWARIPDAHRFRGGPHVATTATLATTATTATTVSAGTKNTSTEVMPLALLASESFLRQDHGDANSALMRWELTAQCLARPDRSAAPITQEELASWLATLAPRLATPSSSRTGPSRTNPTVQFLVLVSATGWTEQAIQSSIQDKPALLLPAATRLAVIDPRQSTAFYRGNDLWLQALGQHLLWEDQPSRIHRIIQLIQQKRPLSTSLAATDLASELNIPLDVVLVALRNIVYSDSRLLLDDIPPFGWVLSERTN